MAGFDGSLRERQCRRSCSAIPAPPANGGYAYVESVGHCRIFSAIPSTSRRCAFAKIRSPDERSDIREHCQTRIPGSLRSPGLQGNEDLQGEKKSMGRLKGKTAMVVGAGSIGP